MRELLQKILGWWNGDQYVGEETLGRINVGEDPMFEQPATPWRAIRRGRSHRDAYKRAFGS